MSLIKQTLGENKATTVLSEGASSTSSSRIKLLIAYDGTNYCGWQRQKNAPTIQGEIEKCLKIMLREEINLHGAGRTDAGVHAMAMVAHYDSTTKLTNQELFRGLNSMLPGAIRIISLENCDPDFHSRFSAAGKTYRYHIHNTNIQPPHTRLYSLHIKNNLDYKAIITCLKILEGSHDFSSFENSGSRDKSNTLGRGAVRTIYSAKLIDTDEIDKITFEFIGDGFLKNMVRNLVGSLLEVGRGKLTKREFREILEAKNRSLAGPTAPAHGLFLTEVLYDQKTGNQSPRE